MMRTLSNHNFDLRVHGKNAYDRYVREQKYEILDQIGKGGNGVIMDAKHKHTNQMYVCKAVPKQNARGKQELVAMMRMQGSNCIRLHDFYEDENNYYIIMDKGWKDLHNTHIERNDHIEEEEVRRIISSVLKTLAQSHAKRLLHLDIKAGNLLWLDENQKKLVLIDWGLSLLMPKDKTYVDMESCAGTPWFMAPEQLRSEASQKSDVWAVGVLCAQLLTKRFPFNDIRNTANPSVAAVWRSILLDPLNTDTHAWNHVSMEAKHFVRWLLQKEPTERPTALEALGHPWLKEHISVHDETTARLSRFQGLDQIHQMFLERLAAKLNMDAVFLSSSLPDAQRIRRDPKTKEVLRQLFDDIDADRDGAILNPCITYCFDDSESAKLSYDAIEAMILHDPDLPLFVYQ